VIKLKELLKEDVENTSKTVKIKTNVPESPFDIDIDQVVSGLRDILKRWKEKEYSSDKDRWKSYYQDIIKFTTHVSGDSNDF